MSRTFWTPNNHDDPVTPGTEASVVLPAHRGPPHVLTEFPVMLTERGLRWLHTDRRTLYDRFTAGDPLCCTLRCSVVAPRSMLLFDTGDEQIFDGMPRGLVVPLDPITGRPWHTFRTILLDMDGVLADLASGLAEVFDRPDLIDGDIYKIEEILGITTKQLWEQVELRGSAFWQQLAIYPWATELHARLSLCGTTLICSAPIRDPACVCGKHAWLHDHYGASFRDFIFTPRKAALAAPDVLLVDDWAVNTEAFVAAGGKACLFPGRHNALRMYSRNPMVPINAYMTQE